MINTGVKEYIFHHVLSKQWLFKHVGQTAITPPVIGYRTTAMGNNKAQIGKIGEQITLQKLHKGGGVGIDIMSTSCMKVWIT